MYFTEDTFEKSFDIKAELKYYKKVCEGKCKQYKDYVEWRSHIEHCVANLNEKMKLPNFYAPMRYKKNDAHSAC